MNLLIRCTMLVFGVFLMACGSDEPAAVVPTTGSMRIKVIDVSSQKSLENTIITVLPTGAAAATNAMGELVLTDIPAGSSTVVATRSEYALVTVDAQVVAGKETPVAIQMSKGSSQHGVILCTVVDSAGKAVEGARVGPLSGASQLTGPGGAVALLQVPTGVVKITGGKDGVGKASATLRVGPDSISVVRLTLLDHQTPPLDGIIMHFPLNGDGSEIVGGSLIDFTGDVRPATDRRGRPGYATSFTGSELSFISSTPIPTAQNQPLSVSFWIKPTVALQNRVWLVSKYLHPTGEGFALFVEGSRLIGLYTVGNFSTYTRSTGLALPKPNQWSHVCMTVSADGGKVYLNGNLIGSNGWRNPATNTDTNEEFRIGYTRSTGTGDTPLPFIGDMDDLVWFGRAIAPTEVMALSLDK